MPLVMLRRLALVHPSYDLRLLVLDPLVNLGTSGRLIPMHSCRKSRVLLAGYLLVRLVFAASLAWVVLVLGCCETVGYAALILWHISISL